MNLRKKLLLIMIGAIIVPLIIGISITYFTLQASIQSMEIDKGKKNLVSVEAYLQLLIDNHQSGDLTWTLWTEYYDAVKNKNIYWINDNILSSIREDSNSELLVVLDKNAKTIASVNIPDDWKKTDFSKFNLLKKLLAGSNSESGLISTSNGLFIATAVKISKADDQEFKDWIGYTIYARKMKSKGLLDTGKQLTGVKIALQLNNKILISTDDDYSTTLKSSSEAEGDETYVTMRSDKLAIMVKAEKTLKDASGAAIGILSSETTSQTGKSALNQLLIISVVLIFILLVSVIIVTLALINMFIKPIVFVTKLMNRLSSGDISFSDTEMNMMDKYKK